ncbi:hypothetical protein [Klebsiella pneumoniae]|uniref:hypothetical protein n=1 Tax=Klebsiella pneumoniae TaxID=573 RepID=UPI001FACC012|nr:hypothetical protein [Klebsiella pneumoniae]MCI7948855.1 hypothetical protein [Klebsiella pneumoniae]WLE40302.1 hypothetical protein LIO06_05035 [Klebsiella pneumoniae]
MSFTITQNIKRITNYPEFGASDAISEIEADVTYNPSRVVGIDSGGAAQVLFEVSVNGSENVGSYFYSFEYSGQGNPLEEAGDKLKEHLSS